MVVYLAKCSPRVQMCHGHMPYVYNNGRLIEEAEIYEGLLIMRDEWCVPRPFFCQKLQISIARRLLTVSVLRLICRLPLATQARDQTVGARWECLDCTKNIQLCSTGSYAIGHTSRRNAALMREMTTKEWGESSEGMVESMRIQSFKRHHGIARKIAIKFQ